MITDIRTLPLTARHPNQAIGFTVAGRITRSLRDNGQRGLAPVTRHLHTQTQGRRKQETEWRARPAQPSPAWGHKLLQLAQRGGLHPPHAFLRAGKGQQVLITSLQPLSALLQIVRRIQQPAMFSKHNRSCLSTAFGVWRRDEDRACLFIFLTSRYRPDWSLPAEIGTRWSSERRQEGGM